LRAIRAILWNSRPERTIVIRGDWEGTCQPWFNELDILDGSQVLSSLGGDGDCRLICEVGPAVSS